MNRGVCRSCGAALIWAETEGGGIIPLDALPAAGGNIAIVGGKARVLTGGLFDEAPPGDRFFPHFRSCPDSHLFRKRRKPK